MCRYYCRYVYSVAFFLQLSFCFDAVRYTFGKCHHTFIVHYITCCIAVFCSISRTAWALNSPQEFFLFHNKNYGNLRPPLFGTNSTKLPNTVGILSLFCQNKSASCGWNKLY